jgi:curved DNA-binding protein CbpA
VQSINYFRVLGVASDATPEEMKSAFRRRCRQTHPDAGGNDDQFTEVTEAYAVLSDPIKRREWEHAYEMEAAALGHHVCPQCFAVNRVRALRKGEIARCANCHEHLEVTSDERDRRYNDALREQLSDLLLTIGAESGALARDAIVSAADGIRKRLGIRRG